MEFTYTCVKFYKAKIMYKPENMIAYSWLEPEIEAISLSFFFYVI